MADESRGRRNGAVEPFLLHLTGPYRGVRQRLHGSRGSFAIGTDRDAAVRFPRGAFRSLAGVQARILPADGAGFLLRPGRPDTVMLNGRRVDDEARLSPGDVISLSESGPSLRFLLLPAGERRYKSMGEALRDCIDCARHEDAGALGRTTAFLRALPRDVMTHTAPAVRILIATLLLLLTVAVAGLAAFGIRLERRIDAGERRAGEMKVAIEETAEEIGVPALRASLEDFAAELAGRVEVLEDLSVAGRRVVETAEPAVVFL
ncbi:MAG: FHA domain-containing protein, partial [Gemmatimonadota bacterium]|nr:FHA domain-containing protein [Gemmatimonadota bacterium]